MAVLAVSCSKKVEVTGNFAGSSPLERIEFIEASGVATLPLMNVGVDEKGSFNGNFDAPKDGVYIMSYAGKQAMLYLKAGQKLNISGQAMNFPEKYTITGDAKNNNDFLLETQKSIQEYASKLNVQEMMTKDETGFVKDMEKIVADFTKNIDAIAKKTSADSDAVQWKKDEINSSILSLMSQYEMSHATMMNNPNFKISKNFTAAEEKFKTDENRMLKNQPIYRNYLLGKLDAGFRNFAQANNKDSKKLTSELFAEFLGTQKDMSQLAKDYLLAFVLSSSEIQPGITTENVTKINTLIKNNIKDSGIRSDIEKVLFVISGPKIGEAAPSSKLIKQDGSAAKLFDKKDKPTMLMFYTSWNPYIAEATVPVLKEVVNFYKSKMDFALVNLDDTKEQFIKTSNAMMKGITATNVYGEGGMSSQVAKDFGIFGFKMPSFILIDKDGKIASRFFYNLGDQEIVTILDKLTGLKAPEVAPEAHLQNDLLAPQNQEPKTENAPAAK